LKNKLRLKSPDRTIGGKMANLWRTVLADLDLVDQINGLLSSYNRKYKADKSSSSLINSHTLRTNAFADNISLKGLVLLLSNLIHIKKIRFTITLTHSNNIETSHDVELFDKRKEDES